MFVVGLILENEGESERHLTHFFSLDCYIFQHKHTSRLQKQEEKLLEFCKVFNIILYFLYVFIAAQHTSLLSTDPKSVKRK